MSPPPTRPIPFLSAAVSVQLIGFISLIVTSVVGPSASFVCSPSCLIHQDIISCRRYNRDDLVACYRDHSSATVLDLSYIVIDEPLGETSFAGLDRVAIMYLDGTRFQSPVGVKTLAAMPRLRTVYLRRLRSSLDDLVSAVVASDSVREVALAENFVVCSCGWVDVVARLAASDVAIVDWDDTAPRCTVDTVNKCVAASTSGSSKTGDVSSLMRRTTRSNSLLTAFQLASLSAAKSQSSDLTIRQGRAGGKIDISMEKRATNDELESIKDDDKLLLKVDFDRSAVKRDSYAAGDVVGLELDAESKFDLGQDERETYERDDKHAEVEQRRIQEEQVVLGDEKAAQKREDDSNDDDDDDDDDEHSNRERAEDQTDGSKLPARKLDKTGPAQWFAHPGTIALLVAITVLFCCCCVYCLTPIKGKVDDMMRGGNGGFMSRFSKNKSSHNASQNATPSDGNATGEEASESAKETTPLVGGSGVLLGDASAPQDDDKKDKKEKKDGKGKSRFRFGSRVENNENESHGGRKWRFGGGATTTPTAQSDLSENLRDELAQVRRQRLGGADDHSSDNNSDDSEDL